MDIWERDIMELRETVFGAGGHPGLKSTVERHDILLEQFIKMKYMLIAQLLATVSAIIVALVLLLTRISS